MSDLGPCDVCGKPSTWGRYVLGCSDHKTALKSAVENCNSNQQLKAEIAALERRSSGFIGSTDAINILNVVLEELRQLSAV